MLWDVQLTERALRDLSRLDSQARDRILAALERLASSGYGDLRPLTGRPGQWRLRVGDYRAIFVYDYDPEEPRIDVLRVLHRREAYR